MNGDKKKVYDYIASRNGNVSINELNQLFLNVYEEEIEDAVGTYLAEQRTIKLVG